jgi:hypothetical protein
LLNVHYRRQRQNYQTTDSTGQKVFTRAAGQSPEKVHNLTARGKPAPRIFTLRAGSDWSCPLLWAFLTGGNPEN